MNRLFYFFILFIFVLSCSLDTKTNIWTQSENLKSENENIEKKIFPEEEVYEKEFNSTLKIRLKSNYKIDLQLSGHTHGMQFGIEIPGFKWSPAKYRYEEWAGLYQEGKGQIYVNRGLGHLAYAGRVGIMPDISILNIKKKI